MRLFLALAASLAAGCALTPAEVLERGTRTEAALKAAPAPAAECVARNAEEMTGSMTARVRAWPAVDGGREVVAHGGAEIGTVGVVQIRPAGAAAIAAVTVTPNTLGDSADFRRRILAGC